MARATRIYIVTYKGEPILARTVKYEMRNKLLRHISGDIDFANCRFWSLPDNSRCEAREVDLNFFTDGI